MSNYLKNRMLNILEQASSSENFYNEGCKSEGCKDEGCGTEGCGTEGCGTEGCSGRYKDEGCDDNTNASLYDGYFANDGDYDDDDEDEDDDEDFDVYEDDDDCIEDCDECAVSLNYSVETIPVFAQYGEYYVEYSMLRKYMDCNNIDTVAEAVSDVCNYNKISKEDIYVVVETARKRKKKVSKSKARKIEFAKSDLSNAINRGITVKTSKKRKKKRKR